MPDIASGVSPQDTFLIRRTSDLVSDTMIQDILEHDDPTREIIRKELRNELHNIAQRLNVQLLEFDRLLGVYHASFSPPPT